MVKQFSRNMFGAFIRNLLFWALDWLQGCPIGKHYSDIKRKEKDNYDVEEDLKTILQYAIDHVSFYKDIRVPELSKFPVMTKAVYKAHPTDIFSDEYPIKEKLHKVSTSGSTGEPMVVYQDANKRNRVIADLIHAHEAVGWNLGCRYIFIRNWVSNYHQSRLKQIAQNVVPVGIAEFNEEKKEWLFNDLRSHRDTVLFGYSSSICDFMTFVRKHKLDGRVLEIKVIVCDSDELTEHNRRMLKETFACPVVNRYDNEENGLIAIAQDGSSALKVNCQSLFVELLELDSDKPVAPGETGRVVITDLYNKAMPLIRYDTGDLASSSDAPGQIRMLDAICGRTASSLFSTDGKRVSSVAISGITEIFYGIEKYQVVQHTADAFEFRFTGVLKDEEQRELHDRLQAALGGKAKIKIVAVTSLDQGANGKFKTIVNEVKVTA